MIILIGSTKGGSGKSTITTNISAALASRGEEVLLLDADRQPTSSEWEAERRLSQPSMPQIVCVQRYGNIDATLSQMARKYTYVIVDVAGRASDEFESALDVADIVVVPVRPSQADLNAVHNTVRFITKARRNNSQLKAYAFLNQAPTNVKGKEISQAREFLSDYSELKTLGAHIHDRKVYRDALSEGLSVIDMSDAKARGEILALISEVIYD